jgi:hypothetical protein
MVRLELLAAAVLLLPLLLLPQVVLLLLLLHWSYLQFIVVVSTPKEAAAVSFIHICFRM